MKWNNKIYEEVASRYPVLQSKKESVALTVLALEKNPDMTADDFRALSQETGIEVRGRAIGSAREILGLKTGAKKKPTGKRRGRPRKDQSAPAAAETSSKRAVSSGAGVMDIAEAIQAMERENRALKATLGKVRDLLANIG